MPNKRRKKRSASINPEQLETRALMTTFNAFTSGRLATVRPMAQNPVVDTTADSASSGQHSPDSQDNGGDEPDAVANKKANDSQKPQAGKTLEQRCERLEELAKEYSDRLIRHLLDGTIGTAEGQSDLDDAKRIISGIQELHCRSALEQQQVGQQLPNAFEVEGPDTVSEPKFGMEHLIPGYTVMADEGYTVMADDGYTVMADDGYTVMAGDGYTVMADDGYTVMAEGGLQTNSVRDPADIAASDKVFANMDFSPVTQGRGRLQSMRSAMPSRLFRGR